MKKIIKKYGDSAVITLTPEDLKIYELKIGDIVEIVMRKAKMEENLS